MTPLRLSAICYRTFERLDLEIPSGCTAIVGPNGAGKSSVLNLIDVCLFADRGELAPLLTQGEDEMELTLEFEHDRELYRVRRRFSKGKATLDLEIQHVDLGPGDTTVWEPLTRETAAATQVAIDELLGLSRTTFRASSFLAQSDGAAFTEAQPRDRKQILAEILNLDVWARRCELVRADLRTREDTIIGSQARIDAATVELSHRPDVLEALARAQEAHRAAATEVNTAEHAHAAAVEAKAANQAALERVKARTAAVGVASIDAERIRRAIVQVEGDIAQRDETAAALDLAVTIAEAQPVLEAKLAAARAERDRANDARRQRDGLIAEAERHEAAATTADRQRQNHHNAALELRGKADHLDAHIGEAAECDRCGQTLGAEAAGRAAASYRSDAEISATAEQREKQSADESLAESKALREQASLISVPTELPEVDALEVAVRDAALAGERQTRIAETLARIDEHAARLPILRSELVAADAAVGEARAELEQARQSAGDQAALEEAERAAVSALASARSRLNDALTATARHQAAAHRLAELEAEQTALVAAQAETRAEIDVLKLAEKMFGRNGIPALIVENRAIPQIETEANRILAELGGATAGCRVELRTQRANKSSDTLRETLDITVVTPAGERPYETFSGGERTRLNLALRIALARLLASRRGAESRLLAIDEPDGLDLDGMERLAAVLNGLSSAFSTVLVVSHNPGLSTAFDQTLTVVKDGERSRIDNGGGIAVAA